MGILASDYTVPSLKFFWIFYSESSFFANFSFCLKRSTFAERKFSNKQTSFFFQFILTTAGPQHRSTALSFLIWKKIAQKVHFFAPPDKNYVIKPQFEWVNFGKSNDFEEGSN